MKPGDVALIALPDMTGKLKLRPALVLAFLPGPYQSLLICGISTQTVHIQPIWDDPIASADSDFATSGLHQDSVIRLSYLRAAGMGEVVRIIGQISTTRLQELRKRLSDHLRP